VTYVAVSLLKRSTACIIRTKVLLYYNIFDIRMMTNRRRTAAKLPTFPMENLVEDLCLIYKGVVVRSILEHLVEEWVYISGGLKLVELYISRTHIYKLVELCGFGKMVDVLANASKTKTASTK